MPWISVKDALPKKAGVYRILADDHNGETDDFYGPNLNGWSVRGNQHITHWFDESPPTNTKEV